MGSLVRMDAQLVEGAAERSQLEAELAAGSGEIHTLEVRRTSQAVGDIKGGKSVAIVRMFGTFWARCQDGTHA